MRLPRPRFTTRRLMVAVAVLAIALGGMEAWRRYREMVAVSEGRRRAAGVYSETADRVLKDASSWERIASEKKRIPDRYPHYTLDEAADHARESREKAGRYRALSSRYERAAGRPWLPVTPDPPEPK